MRSTITALIVLGMINTKVMINTNYQVSSADNLMPACDMFVTTHACMFVVQFLILVCVCAWLCRSRCMSLWCQHIHEWWWIFVFNMMIYM